MKYILTLIFILASHLIFSQAPPDEDKRLFTLEVKQYDEAPQPVKKADSKRAHVAVKDTTREKKHEHIYVAVEQETTGFQSIVPHKDLVCLICLKRVIKSHWFEWKDSLTLNSKPVKVRKPKKGEIIFIRVSS